MNSKITSGMREYVNIVTQKLIFNERIRKKLVIKYYNMKTSCNHRICYSSEQERVFNYRKIINEKKHLCKEEYRGNGFYGIADVIKDYSGFRGKIFACIEHGVYFGNYVNEKECVVSGFPAVITFGPKRKYHIRKKSNKLLFTIGPYIYYAHDMLNESDIHTLKKKFGKTLLVFPTHSVDRVSVKLSSNSLIEKINIFKTKYGFDTVMVCLYYRDLELGRAIEYEEAGFIVVSAGRREDHMFLHRLHTFFSLADYTVSNNVGTHIGYSIILNRPHTILCEEIEYDIAGKSEKRHVTTLYNSTAVEEKGIVENCFKNYSEYITDEQRAVCNLFWGNDLVLTPDQMKFILECCNDVFMNSKKSEKYFEKNAKLYSGKMEKNPYFQLYKQAID